MKLKANLKEKCNYQKSPAQFVQDFFCGSSEARTGLFRRPKFVGGSKSRYKNNFWHICFANKTPTSHLSGQPACFATALKIVFSLAAHYPLNSLFT